MGLCAHLFLSPVQEMVQEVSAPGQEMVLPIKLYLKIFISLSIDVHVTSHIWQVLIFFFQASMVCIIDTCRSLIVHQYREPKIITWPPQSGQGRSVFCKRPPAGDRRRHLPSGNSRGLMSERKCLLDRGLSCACCHERPGFKPQKNCGWSLLFVCAWCICASVCVCTSERFSNYNTQWDSFFFLWISFPCGH